MRPRTVRGVTLALSALFALAALLFALNAPQPSREPTTPGPAPEGASIAPEGAAALYQRWCASCHVAGELVEDLARSPDETVAALETLRLLEHHGSSPPQEDLWIVLWMVEQARARRPAAQGDR